MSEMSWKLTADGWLPVDGFRYEIRLLPLEPGDGVWRATYRARDRRFMLTDGSGSFALAHVGAIRGAFCRTSPVIQGESAAGAGFSDLTPEQRVDQLKRELDGALRREEAAMAREREALRKLSGAEGLAAELAEMNRRAEVAEKALADYRAEDAAQGRGSLPVGPLTFTGEVLPNGQHFVNVLDRGNGFGFSLLVEPEVATVLRDCVRAFNVHGQDPECLTPERIDEWASEDAAARRADSLRIPTYGEGYRDAFLRMTREES